MRIVGSQDGWVEELAFHLDGTLLASSGRDRYPCLLWCLDEQALQAAINS
ncbi:MAG: hypothetical protein AAF702_15995 [Chloroflexota bacterium]